MKNKLHFFFKTKFRVTRIELLIVVMFLIIGFALRILGANWGETHIFQPDEKKLVKASIQMVEERTLLHDYYSYPNEFTSKIVAIIIYIWAGITHTEIDSQTIECYFIFRGCMAALSTALIGISYLIGNYLHKRLGIILGGLVTLFPPFINYAKQVTGDIPVAFFASLAMLASFFYLENGKNKNVVIMSLFAALSTLEKWHGGVLCIYIAVLILYRGIKEKKIEKFIMQGFIALGAWLGWIALFAPNMVWNWKTALEEILSIYVSGDWYVRPDDIWVFFWKCFFSHGGIAGTLVLLFGFISLWKYKQEKYLVLLAGGANWLILSAIMNRIFERWGLEFYLVLLIVSAMGILYLYEQKARWMKIIAMSALFVIMLNYISGCIRYDVLAMYSRQDTRLIGEVVFEELGINMENSIYDYYTPFSPGGIRTLHGHEGQKSKTMNDYIIEENEDIYVTEAGKRFAIASSYRGAGSNSGGYALLNSKASHLGDILSFHPDLFHANNGMGSWRTLECVSIWRNWTEIRGVLRGEAMGPLIKIYDISDFPVKISEEN